MICEGDRKMKQRILLSFLIIFLISSLGAVFAYLHVRNTNDTLSRLINLHQIETLRQQLLRSIQTVQSDLYTVHTKLGNNLDYIVENVTGLEQAARNCTSCHHSPEIARQIDELQLIIQDYQKSLSYYITASANADQISKNKQEAARIGNDLLVKTEDMSMLASTRLKSVSTDAMRKVQRVSTILMATMMLALLLGVIAAMYLARAITRPVDALLDATRMITSGNLGYSIEYQDHTEFGELASHFNVMSTSLRTSYAKLEEEISEHRRTEAALMKSESFLNTIFDSIRDPFCIIDSEYRIVRANEAYAAMKQVPLENLPGKICYEVHQKRQSTCDECIVQKTFATGNSFIMERCSSSPAGAKDWTVKSTYPIIGTNGEITHVIEYSQNITGRKASEEALRESEERYALAALGSNDGLWDWDLRKKSVYYSSRWKSMLGYADEELGNQPEEWLSRVHPDDRPELEIRIAAHISGRDSHLEDEFRIMHKDGTYHWMLARGLAVRNATGQAYRMAGSQTDITSSKTTTEQLVYNAFHDALTGLPNRSLFTDRLQHIITTSVRRGEPLYAVLFLDLDRFKIINDSLGHLVGDKLLVAVGPQLTRCLRSGDTIARLGGNEFSILLEDIGELKAAVDVADRIHHNLSTPFIIDGHEIFTTVSIGIALGSKLYDRAGQVLRDAEIAQSEAKNRGGAGTEIFDAGMLTSILDNIKIES